MLEIILYTTHCPKCRVLETKLQRKNMVYTSVTDIEQMKAKGIQSVPMIQVGEELLDFEAANKYINDYQM